MQDDDELRELFRSGRADDRDHAPAFEQMWQSAQGDRPPRRHLAWGLAAAAVFAVGLGWLAFDEPAVVLPDTPAPIAEVVPPAAALDEPLELARWEPTVFSSPTDFLLDDDGSLAGGVPSSTFDDPALDLDDLTMEL